MNNKNGQMKIGLFVMLFVGVIVALALIVPIADTTNQLTEKQSVTNQTVDIETAYINSTAINESINYTIYSQSTWKQSQCPLESVVIINGANTTLAEDTDYTLYEAQGVFSLLNTSDTLDSATLNTSLVSYGHCADGYNTNGGSRSIARIVVIFSALAVLAFVTVGIKNEWFK